MTYPASHFVGTPPLGIWVVEQGIIRAGVKPEKWTVPLEVIARYETDWDPYAVGYGLGLMQLTDGMYKAAGFPEFVTHPVTAVEVAIAYILGQLEGYGGYGNIGTVDGTGGLLPRTDRGPGNVLRAWIKDPTLTVAKLRSLYHGF